MSTRTELLKLFQQNAGVYLSGQSIGDALHISRNAIWKAVNQLRKEGYDIESKSGAGYLFKREENRLTLDAIAAHLRYPCELKVFEEVGSTNNIAKESQVGLTPLLVVANRQTAGRGRLGRTFASPGDSGIYMTLALRPTFDLNKSLYVTMAVAVAVCRAVEKVAGVKGRIKWVNDIFFQQKKVCGILTEAQSNFETGKIDTLIIGIGINCFPGALPEDLKNIAGCLAEDANAFSRAELTAEIVNETMEILENLDSMAFLREYRSKCFILGKNIYIHPNLDQRSIRARAIDIDDNGCLVVEYMEGRTMRQMETLTTGEVSIRLDE